MKTYELFRFANERQHIYRMKVAGKLKPWTDDPIFQNYRFSNAYRELDKTTVWIAKNWREPYHTSALGWFAMCVARYFNWPATLEEIGYPVPWQPERIIKMLYKNHTVKLSKMMSKSHKNTPYKIERIQTKISPQIFGGAYFLNSIGPKIESIVNDRLTPLWEERRSIMVALSAQSSLRGVHGIFMEQHGFGSFMAAQVVADLKYTPLFSERKMYDWWTWAASGPGSKRGLNRVVDRDLNASWTEAGWLECLTELRNELLPMVKKAKMPVPHAQDVQNWLCEFDKYERVRLGEGRPKQKYPGGK